MNNAVTMLSVLKDAQSNEMPFFRFDNVMEMEKYQYFRQALDAGFITTTDHDKCHSSEGYQYFGASVTLKGAEYIYKNDGALLRQLWVNNKKEIILWGLGGLSTLVSIVGVLIYQYNFIAIVQEVLTFSKQ